MNWQLLVENLGTTVSVVAGVCWIGKQIIAHFLSHDLETFKNELEKSSQKEIHDFTAKLETERGKFEKNYSSKMDLYKEASTPIIEMLAKFPFRTSINQEELIAFEKKRMEIHALLGMFAPLKVIHAYDKLIDYVLDCMQGSKAYDFNDMRSLAYKCISEVRRDIGLEKDDVTYSGHR